MTLHESFTLNQPPYSSNTEEPFERDTYHGRDTRGSLPYTLMPSRLRSTEPTHSPSLSTKKTVDLFIGAAAAPSSRQSSITLRKVISMSSFGGFPMPRGRCAVLTPHSSTPRTSTRRRALAVILSCAPQIRVKSTRGSYHQIKTVPQNRRLVISFTNRLRTIILVVVQDASKLTIVRREQLFC
jgi:hypothetical protein